CELIDGGFSRFAEANLIRGDDAIAFGYEILDREFPCGRAEILSVQQHNGSAVWVFRLDVEIGHLQRLALRSESETLDRKRIVESFEFLSIDRPFIGLLLRGRLLRKEDRKRSKDKHRLEGRLHYSAPLNLDFPYPIVRLGSKTYLRFHGISVPSQKTKYSLQQMWSVLPPTTDMRRLRQDVRLVPGSDLMAGSEQIPSNWKSFKLVRSMFREHQTCPSDEVRNYS